MLSRYKILVAVLSLVARLEHQVDLVAERIQQVEEQVEHRFLGGGPHQHGNFDARVGVLVNVVPVARLRNDLQVVRGTHGVGQHEVAVPRDIQMRLELVLRDVLKTAPLRRGSPFPIGVGQKPLQETHQSLPQKGERVCSVSTEPGGGGGRNGPATFKEI